MVVINLNMYIVTITKNNNYPSQKKEIFKPEYIFSLHGKPEQTILENKNKVGRFTLSNFKTYQNAIVIQDQTIGQCNSIKNPKINP